MLVLRMLVYVLCAACWGGVLTIILNTTECVLAPHEEVVLGTAALLAEALKGAHHSMHSRSAVLLQLVLDDAVLLRVAAVLDTGSAAKGKRARRGRTAKGAEAVPDELVDVAHGRVRALVTVTMDRLWEHLRRGGCGGAWGAIMEDAKHALDAMQGRLVACQCAS